MQFIGSDYLGLTTSDGKRFDGLGQFTFPNGDRYIGGILDGLFHGHGILFFRKRREGEEGAKTPGGGGAAAADRRATVARADEALAEEAELMDFLDRCRKPRLWGETSTTETAAPDVGEGEEEGNAAADDEDNDDNRSSKAEEWSGQFRGVWEHGHNISGSYLFFDGLVYSSETHPSGQADRERKKKAAASSGGDNVWPYCECNDRRVWSEHLRNITPVLPYESPLGGIALQEALVAAKKSSLAANPTRSQAAQRLWPEVPILVPSSPDNDLAPSVFAHGQPKSGADAGRWHAILSASTAPDEKTLEGLRTMASILAMPTEPLVEEQDPDVETDADGTVHSRRRLVTDPNYQLRYLLSGGGGAAASDDKGMNGGVMVSGDGSKRALTPCVPGASRGGAGAALAESSSFSSDAALPAAVHTSEQEVAPEEEMSREPEVEGSCCAPPAALSSSPPAGIVAPGEGGASAPDASSPSTESGDGAAADVDVSAGREVEQTLFSPFLSPLYGVVAAATVAGGEAETDEEAPQESLEVAAPVRIRFVADVEQTAGSRVLSALLPIEEAFLSEPEGDAVDQEDGGEGASAADAAA